MQSQIMTCYNYPASLMNQNEIPIELPYWLTHLALIMSLISTKVLANMRWWGDAMLQLSCKFGQSIWNPLLTHRVKELIWQ